MGELDGLRENLRTVAPEFDAVPDETLARLFALFSPLVGRKWYGKVRGLAFALLIAHKLKLGGYTNAAGETVEGLGDNARVNSISEGDVSVSYGNLTQGSTGGGVSGAEYGLTPYGLEFLALLRYCDAPIRISGGRF
jgi:hypothetical protein